MQRMNSNPSLYLPVLLDLRWNNMGLLGGRSLLEALQQNQTLVQLEMAGNNVPCDTLKALGTEAHTHAHHART